MMIRDQLNLAIRFDRKPKTAEALYGMFSGGMSLPDFKQWYCSAKTCNNLNVVPASADCLTDFTRLLLIRYNEMSNAWMSI